jgi:hypothetical protein
LEDWMIILLARDSHMIHTLIRHSFHFIHYTFKPPKAADTNVQIRPCSGY